MVLSAPNFLLEILIITVVAFGQQADVLTVEIEHVNTDALKSLKAAGKIVHPDPDILEIIKDKGLQKQFYDCLLYTSDAADE